jgi:hypothetical protein
MWTVGKDEPIRALIVDPRAIPSQSRLPLWSVTRDAMCSWDGLRAVNWIEKRMIERQPDYCTFREVKVLVVSWNIDSAKPSDLSSGGIENTNFLTQVLGSVESPDIIVFGFQEVVPLTDKKLTASELDLARDPADKQRRFCSEARARTAEARRTSASRAHTARGRRSSPMRLTLAIPRRSMSRSSPSNSSACSLVCSPRRTS